MCRPALPCRPFMSLFALCRHGKSSCQWAPPLSRLHSAAGALKSSKAFATTFPYGLTGPGATDASYTAALDLSKPLLLRGSGDFMAAARADARVRLRLRKNSRASAEVEASVRQHLASATALSEDFKLSSEVHDREETRAALEGSCRQTGQLSLLLGGKSVGKSLLLGELAQRKDIVGAGGALRAVLYIDARVFGMDLAAGLLEALDDEIVEVSRSGYMYGARRTQAERRGRVTARSRSPALPVLNKVTLKGSLGALGLEGEAALGASPGASLTIMQRNLAMLTRVVAAYNDKGLYLCLIVDEANLTFPMPPAPSAAAAATPLPPEEQRTLLDTKLLLEGLVQLTKQANAMNVLLVSSEYAYPYRLRHGSFFTTSNLSDIFIASEVPPASMRELLQVKWGLGPRLSDVLLAYCGGHAHMAARALHKLSGRLDTFRVEELAPDGAGAAIARCLEEEEHQGMRQVLADLASRGFAPVAHEGSACAQALARANLGGLVSASATALGLPAEARGGAELGLVAASHFTRHLIAKALHNSRPPTPCQCCHQVSRPSFCLCVMG